MGGSMLGLRGVGVCRFGMWVIEDEGEGGYWSHAGEGGSEERIRMYVSM